MHYALIHYCYAVFMGFTSIISPKLFLLAVPVISKKSSKENVILFFPSEFICVFHMILKVNSHYFLSSIYQLIFVMEMHCVFFVVWTELLNVI